MARDGSSMITKKSHLTDFSMRFGHELLGNLELAIICCLYVQYSFGILYFYSNAVCTSCSRQPLYLSYYLRVVNH